jgi:hypothetical protein
VSNFGGWVNREDDDGYLHVLPIGDTRDHIEELGCWCEPAHDEECDMVVHNSHDRREEFERGRKPS